MVDLARKIGRCVGEILESAVHDQKKSPDRKGGTKHTLRRHDAHQTVSCAPVAPLHQSRESIGERGKAPLF